MPSWTGNDDEPFDPRFTPAAEDLGVVAELFWHQPGVERSDHPFAFAAFGPLAKQIVSGPLPLPPHALSSPVGKVYELDGQVLLLGVGHDADTTLHLAEILAKVPYRLSKYCTVFEHGHPIKVCYNENDHCCARFSMVDEWLRKKGLQSEGMVGHAHSRLARSRDIITVALKQLNRNPLVFLHRYGSGCVECDEAHRSIACP
jgi:aminoglycoside 3-N-acetyltransferase